MGHLLRFAGALRLNASGARFWHVAPWRVNSGSTIRAVMFPAPDSRRGERIPGGKRPQTHLDPATDDQRIVFEGGERRPTALSVFQARDRTLRRAHSGRDLLLLRQTCALSGRDEAAHQTMA